MKKFVLGVLFAALLVEGMRASGAEDARQNIVHLRNLSSNVYVVRQSSSIALKSMSTAVLPLLQEVLKSDAQEWIAKRQEPEWIRRVDEVLNHIFDGFTEPELPAASPAHGFLTASVDSLNTVSRLARLAREEPAKANDRRTKLEELVKYAPVFYAPAKAAVYQRQFKTQAAILMREQGFHSLIVEPSYIQGRQQINSTEFSKALRELTFLKRLSLENVAVKNAEIEGIQALQNLEELNLTKTDVTDCCLASVGKLKRLKRLRLDLLPLGQGLSHLAGCSQLDRLSMRDCKIASLKSFPTLPCLSVLLLCGTEPDEKLTSLPEYDKQLAEVISRCAKLEYIDLQAAAFENETLAALARLINLKILDLSLAARPLDVDALAKIHQVSHLRLQESRLSNGNLDFLNKFENLQFLDLGSQKGLKAVELTKLSACKQLRQLWLGSAHIGDDELAALASISQLTFLEMSYSNVTDAGMKHIEKLAALKHLSLPGNRQLTGRILEHVGKLKALETLDVCATDVDDASLVYLYGLRKLVGLAVEDTKVTRTGVEALKTKLPKCTMFFD